LASPANRAASLRTPAVVEALRRALGDARDPEARAIAYAALAHCGDAVEATAAAVELRLVAALVERLGEELTGYAAPPPSRGRELVEAVLLALRRMLAHTSQALSCDQALEDRRAVALLLECVAAPRAAEATQVRALGCLALLAGEPKGKGAVLAEAGAVELMLARCRAASAAVAAGAAGVLAGVLIEDDGKRAVLAAADWPALAALVRPGAPAPVLLAACTALGAFSAHPAARAALREAAPGGSGAERLRAVAEASAPGAAGASAAVHKAAQRALATVEWEAS